MKTINFNALANVSNIVAKVKGGIKKANKFATTLEGAKARLCNEWNNGYNEAVIALGFNKPSEFNAYVTELIEGHKLNDGLWTTITVGKGENAKEVEVPAIYVSKKKLDKSQSEKDINGVLRYLIVKDDKGHAVKEDVLSGIVRYTPDVLIKLAAMDMYMNGLLADDIAATAEAKKAEAEAKKAEAAAKKDTKKDTKKVAAKKDTKKVAAKKDTKKASIKTAKKDTKKVAATA